MKKLLILLVGLLFNSFVFSQDAIRFTMGLNPNHSYDQNMIQKISIEINLDSSSDEMIHNMEAKGMKNPTIQEQEIRLEGLLKSGSIDPKTGKMPVTMSFVSGDEKMSKILSPNLKIIGTAFPNELPAYDSVSGGNFDEKQKAQMLKIMSAMSQFKLPNKDLKPGQSDTLNTPINIPMAGLTMKMDYITIYHLISIQGKTALFDISAVFKLSVDMKDMPFDGSGSGDGTMEYDLENRYPIKYNLNYSLKMRLAKDGLIMHMSMKANLNNLCKIQSL